LNPREWFG